ncbi:M23 family metallopeptidase [Eubacteriales bacterium OttesenSCG-928-M02]|nr:M23 family metallopeptidase [Eubacteriales bacterium OttesenSCG-928-M02]
MDNNNFSRRNNRGPIDEKSGFLQRNGVYAVVIICLILVGVAAYFTFDALSPQKAEVPTPEPQQVIAPKPTPIPVKEPDPTPTPAPTPAPKEDVPTAANNPAPQKMVLPLDGEADILRAYSPTDPIYFEGLNEWMAHIGVDLKAQEGASVKACLDGTVESVVNDPANGYTITIVSGSKKVVYANVGSLDMVKKGQAVKQGDAISLVKNSAASTAADPPHIHLEYYEGDAHKDPLAAIK